MTDDVGAFVPGPRVRIEGRAGGPLTGLTFAAKDLFDVAGVPTGGGNHDWPTGRPVPTRHAWAVQTLLDAGATLIGKTITDEVSLGILGENAFDGTPVNVRARGRVPGGSSSGSAAAVAAGLCDTALGTDTGGSVRVPASFCGLYGIRPTHGRIDVAGMLPQAPTSDTTGWFARDGATFARVSSVMLGEVIPSALPTRLVVAVDAFGFADDTVAAALQPMVRRLDEGRELIAAAEKSGAVLQVGHVERFNPAVRALRDYQITPRYIEAARVAPFPFRSTDVGVVLDLMIHDIDIVLHLANSPVKSVEAIGVPVLMGTEDIANARIVFENGCVANLTASRVATKSERKIRVFSRDSYLVLDFGRREGYLYRKSPELTAEVVQSLIGQAVAGGKSTIGDLQGKVFTDLIKMDRLEIPEGDALTEEIRDFLRCVRERSKPAVSGREGLAAVSVALDVLAAIERG